MTEDTHSRHATHLTVGRGLGAQRAVWNRQGHPFYDGPVAYRQNYTVREKEGRYFVVLPNWYGSVARVLVNGRPAGQILCAPWECHVSSVLQKGDNAIEVVVIGTLKNLLGPHHGGRSRGSAWPGMFQQGPAQGPPPGSRYDSIGYGLFESFTVKQVVRK